MTASPPSTPTVWVVLSDNYGPSHVDGVYSSAEAAKRAHPGVWEPMGDGWISRRSDCEMTVYPYAVQPEGCDVCRDEDLTCYPFDTDGEWSGLVSHEIGWCGCGDPDRVDELMVRYLSQPDQILTFDDDAGLLLAYIADDLRWTEHGGAVGGSWLTDAGREALANLVAHLTPPPAPPSTEETS